MDNSEKIAEEIRRLRALDRSHESIDRKLDELIVLLKASNLDSNIAQDLQNKFNSAIEKAVTTIKDIEEFEELDKVASSREEHVLNIESFLLNHEVDSILARKIRIVEKVKQIAKACIALLLITLGFAMIILPAPPNFEMFTIFHFNLNDGVTLMDLISLLVVFTGIYLLITSFIKQRRYN